MCPNFKNIMAFFRIQWLILLEVLVYSNSLQADHQCHPWSFYNRTLQQCQCYQPSSVLDVYDIPNIYIIECSERRALIKADYCVTVDEIGTFVGYCQRYVLDENITLVDGRYIQLPDNISELNDYMCGPMNRKGRVCSKCIDGFAPSVTSLEYECSNCTGVWYGISLYLFLEFVPITIFYLAILVFQISMTVSPMTTCVMYSQIAVYFLSTLQNLSVVKLSHENTLIMILFTFHGIWNLDFFHYIVPPFCVSPNLKNIHIAFLGYISAAVYPLLLIFLTWVSVQLHSHNYQPFVWLWSKLGCLKPNRYSKTTIVDIFATFFFLSYTKLCFISAFILRSTLVYQANSTHSYAVVYIDPSIHFFSKEHTPYAVVAALILLVFGVLPALLLAAYPVRKLRSLLFLDRLSGRSKAALNIFVEKFYSCYRDGLDGGRDMRSFASLHLFIRLLTLLLVSWIYPTIFYGACCLLILLVRPCKKTYMNNIDALVIAFLTLNSFQADKIKSMSLYSHFYLWSGLVTACLPLFIIYVHLIPQKYLIKVRGKVIKLSVCKKLICLKDDDEMQGRELSESTDPDHPPGRIGSEYGALL